MVALNEQKAALANASAAAKSGAHKLTASPWHLVLVALLAAASLLLL